MAISMAQRQHNKKTKETKETKASKDSQNQWCNVKGLSTAAYTEKPKAIAALITWRCHRQCSGKGGKRVVGVVVLRECSGSSIPSQVEVSAVTNTQANEAQCMSGIVSDVNMNLRSNDKFRNALPYQRKNLKNPRKQYIPGFAVQPTSSQRIIYNESIRREGNEAEPSFMTQRKAGF
ncbi:conserved hypothetical protein [Ricinus communis]|uniref:Uncharacterized protein n=1 Tax=Ricinus communis TaxID=3988 RepID=B9RYM9_RICCO|nr:conserved hypothetical protein [Ricinus communis]